MIAIRQTAIVYNSILQDILRKRYRIWLCGLSKMKFHISKWNYDS
jgi:hypothetical protein